MEVSATTAKSPISVAPPKLEPKKAEAAEPAPDAESLELETPTLTSFANIQETFAAGKIARFDDSSFSANREIFAWSLDDWSRRFGKHHVNLHVIPPRIEEAALKRLAAMPDDAPVTFERVIMDALKDCGMENPPDAFDSQSLPISDVILEMRKLEGERFPLPYSRASLTASEVRLHLRKFHSYAVTNARSVEGFSYRYHEAFDAWRGNFAFLWFGTSPGGLHFDHMDNTLIQLHGTKSVLIFPHVLTDAIDGNAHVTSFDCEAPLSPAVLAAHPYMKFLPYHVVHLRAGEGVVLPSGAYHSPYATSHDSISLNTFLFPHFRTGPFPAYSKNRLSPADWSQFLASRKAYDLTGRKILKRGPYEYF